MESNGNEQHWKVQDPIQRVELALEALNRGDMVILMDDED